VATTHVATRDGHHLNVEVRGSNNSETIIFAHEFGGDRHSWAEQAENFAHTYRCITFDARGFTPSSVPPNLDAYGQHTAVSDLHAIALALNANTFHLVGISMGSYTSLMFALQHPRMLRTLTLIGCSDGPTDDTTAYHAALERELTMLEQSGGTGAVEWFSNDPAYQHMPRKQPGQWKVYLRRLHDQSVTGAMNILQTVHWKRRALSDFDEQITTLDTPTLLAWGTDDHPRVLSTADYLRQHLSSVEVLEVPATGHLVHLEEPELFRSHLQRHLHAHTSVSR
jgi:pimeloyl-ACP methyl ester carboxylesterase